ncbi:MAG: hypothetical protein H6719_02185 [Sandaracinaceae bacterium]|nr:hypothetical protein [Sandaracinaceae bacterium]
MRREQLTLYVLIGAIVVLPLGLDRLRARAHHEWSEAQAYEDVYYLPPNEWLRAFSLGWNEALADLIWMRALVYYGDEMVHHGDVEFVFRYGEAIESLDPDFVAVYRWVGTAGLYRPQAITVDDVNRTVEFMERGARRHPDDGQLAWDLGAVLAYELPPMLEDVEAGNRARERALPFLLRASRLGAAPEWAALSNAALMGRIGRTDQAARHLEEMYAQTDDPATRERMATRIRQLQDQAHAEAFLAAMEQLEDRRRRTFPYAPPSFLLLLGERPPVDVDSPIRLGLPEALATPP